MTTTKSGDKKARGGRKRRSWLTFAGIAVAATLVLGACDGLSGLSSTGTTVHFAFQNIESSGKGLTFGPVQNGQPATVKGNFGALINAVPLRWVNGDIDLARGTGNSYHGTFRVNYVDTADPGANMTCNYGSAFVDPFGDDWQIEQTANKCGQDGLTHTIIWVRDDPGHG